MQREIEIDHPELDITIIGLNLEGLEAGNPLMADGRNLPLLQDVDENGDHLSDVWSLWNVSYRDVVILNGGNEPVGVFNLTNRDLANPEHYDMLSQMFVEAASTAVPEPSSLILIGVGLCILLAYRWQKA